MENGPVKQRTVAAVWTKSGCSKPVSPAEDIQQAAGVRGDDSVLPRVAGVEDGKRILRVRSRPVPVRQGAHSQLPRRPHRRNTTPAVPLRENPTSVIPVGPHQLWFSTAVLTRGNPNAVNPVHLAVILPGHLCTQDDSCQGNPTAVIPAGHRQRVVSNFTSIGGKIKLWCLLWQRWQTFDCGSVAVFHVVLLLFL